MLIRFGLIRFLRATSLAASALLVVGCAGLATPPTYGLDAHSASLVRQTCNDVMGLRAGPEHEACTDSLADTVRIIQDSRLTSMADTACEQQGLQRGTAELAKCVVMFRHANNIASSNIAVSSISADATQPWVSYFSMSDAQKVHRAELSCAQLGLHPSWGAFSYCVTDLRQSILNIRDLSLP